MVAAYTQEDFLKSLDRLHDERLITLKLVYMIPGYGDANLDTKNYIYDLALNRVRSLKEEAWHDHNDRKTSRNRNAEMPEMWIHLHQAQSML